MDLVRVVVMVCRRVQVGVVLFICSGLSNPNKLYRFYFSLVGQSGCVFFTKKKKKKRETERKSGKDSKGGGGVRNRDIVKSGCVVMTF